MKSLNIFFLFLFYFQIFFTQTDEIKGVIVDKKTNEPIFGATAKILIDSNFIGNISGFKGNFSIKNIYKYEGGLPAKYGDTKSNATIIETKSYFEVLWSRENYYV